MSFTAHVFPSWGLALGQKQADVLTDSLQVLLIVAGTYTCNATALAAVHVSDFLAGSGSGALTEVSTVGTGYSRLALATVGLADTYAGSTGYTTLTVSTDPSWAAPSFTTSYALFFDNTIGGTDAANQVICYWDFNGSQAATPAKPYTLTMGSLNGVTHALLQYQSS